MKTIHLTMKEEKRFEVMNMAVRGEITMEQAAQVLGVCLRQAYRLKSKTREKGVRGVIHGNRGRKCPWSLSRETRDRIVSLREGKYKGFNDTHFTEKLAGDEGIAASRETVRRILRKAGVASPRKRRPGKYRSRREPKESEGLMLQTDGSHHDWLEGRGPRLCLVGAIDDATNKVPAAVFEDAETTGAYFEMFEGTFKKKGIPHSIYADRTSILYTKKEPTIEEQLANKRPMTQVARALDELGVTLIAARSPQGKGRIERLWGTFQDRLTSELRLAGASTKQEAQAVLDRFLPEHNRKFARKPKNPKPAWRKIPDGVDLKRILCWKYTRTVARDNTISFNSLKLQLPKVKPFYSLAGKKVETLVLRNHIIEVYHQNRKVAGFTKHKIKTEVAGAKNKNHDILTLQLT